MAVAPLAATELAAPTLDAKSIDRPADAKVLLDGKDLCHWRSDDGGDAKWKVVEGGAVEVGADDLVARERFAGDFRLHVEFMTPAMPHATGQAKGNSGVFVADAYEIQVLDSYGQADVGLGDCGAVYSKSAPTKNVAKPSGEWQTYEIEYRAPRWDAAGNKLCNARLTLWWNGEKVQDNLELDGPCPGARPESPQGGPIRLQDHGNAVRFRNLWVAPLVADK